MTPTKLLFYLWMSNCSKLGLLPLNGLSLPGFLELTTAFLTVWETLEELA